MVSDLGGKGTAMRSGSSDQDEQQQRRTRMTAATYRKQSKGGSDVKERQPTAVKVEEQRPAAVKVKEQGSGGSNLRSGVFD
ncbi:hypothetical protein WN943_027203 [Citrus x changshan-huyou]